MKVKINREECIGCRACIGVAPELFEMGDDNKSRLKGVAVAAVQETETTDEKAKEAEGVCPVQCIHVE